ncbi:MAG: hypothetical protein Q7R35_11495 [Elusimicrobiota bacterium]|nr:hypothetical protein [Elusimicrobiota bacterium]
MIKKLAIIAGVIFLAAGGAAAAAIVEREFTCPVCVKSFYAKLDVADSKFEMRLDLKPDGPIFGPWLLPDCPACGFVTYKYPVPKAELVKCRGIAASEDFKKIRERSTYFRVGLIYEKLGKSTFTVANSFLRASWQEESEPAKLKEDLELSLKFFTDCALNCINEEKENSQLLTGELLRRLGRFEEARAHLAGLQRIKGFQKNFFADIVEYQLKLCSKLDSTPHTMADVKEFKKPFIERMNNKLKKFINDLTD